VQLSNPFQAGIGRKNRAQRGRRWDIEGMLLAPRLHRELAREWLRPQNIRTLETFANSVVKILIGSIN